MSCSYYSYIIIGAQYPLEKFMASQIVDNCTQEVCKFKQLSSSEQGNYKFCPFCGIKPGTHKVKTIAPYVKISPSYQKEYEADIEDGRGVSSYVFTEGAYIEYESIKLEFFEVENNRSRESYFVGIRISEIDDDDEPNKLNPKLILDTMERVKLVLEAYGLYSDKNFGIWHIFDVSC